MSFAINTNFQAQQNLPKIKQQKPANIVQNEGTNDKKLKIISGCAAAKGIGVALGFIAKKHKIPFKNQKITTIMKNIGAIKYSPLEIIALAGASVGAGLTAGIIVDSGHKKEKLREAVQQMVGNILIPIGCVTVASKFYKKHENKLQLPKIKSNSKIAKTLNGVLKNIPTVGFPLGGLAIGILAGNYIANQLSKSIFHVKNKREIKISDFSGHVDDICLAAMLVSPTSKIGEVAGRVIPFALMVPGYQTGISKGEE